MLRSLGIERASIGALYLPPTIRQLPGVDDSGAARNVLRSRPGDDANERVRPHVARVRWVGARSTALPPLPSSRPRDGVGKALSVFAAGLPDGKLAEHNLRGPRHSGRRLFLPWTQKWRT
jgi:hypothetical protein